MATLTQVQRDILRAVVDTAVPALAVVPDPTGFWGRRGSDVGADAVVQRHVEGLNGQRFAALAHLLDALAAQDFTASDVAGREALLARLSASSTAAASAVRSLRATACMAAAMVPDVRGRNPFWEHWGYPGPVVVPPRDEQPHIRAHIPDGHEVLAADVVVVGSGAGGGTIAGVLAARGLRVVVLEAGGATSRRDYTQLEAVASPMMLYRGGAAYTADRNVALLAGATLGGGTTVNWQNCVAPSARMRREWASGHGLSGLDAEDFDRHLRAVLARMGANDRCSDFNGPHQRMAEGAGALGWSLRTAVRNVDEATYDPALAGYTQFGDPSGSKRGTLTTYLEDAFDHGARILVHTHADQICAAGGRASGVTATYTDPQDGRRIPVRVDAAQVVVACGALETPALLLRSGIGGPATGRHLRVHPSLNMFGVYAEDQRAWWGPPQAAIVDEFRDLDGEGYGVIIEGSQYYTGIYALQLARDDGRQHKEAMSRLGRMANFVSILREHGGGGVTVDARGRAVHSYELHDPRDRAALHRGIRALAELHLAAGAEQLWMGVPSVPPHARGDDLQAWLDRIERLPVGAGGLVMGSAHQMGTARMGADPATSVAGPHGELHDVRGVWIGDTSAFPTASGANPMLTCMALAHRTAARIGGHDA